MTLLELADRVEKATGPDRELDLAISVAVNFREIMPAGAPGEWRWGPGGDELELWIDDKRRGLLDPAQFVPRWTSSLDAAMTLVPSTAVNLDLFSFTRGGGHPAWGCRFHDTAQLMGKRAAKKEIARLNKGLALGRQLRGAPRVVLEKAIAEHFMEFYCTGAANPALALTAACLKARSALLQEEAGR